MQSSPPTAVPSFGLATALGAADVLQLFSVDGAQTGGGGNSSPGATSSAGVASSPPIAPTASPSSPVRAQTANGKAPVRTQGARPRRAAGVLGRTRVLARRVPAGTLPFTGSNPALWGSAGLVLLAAGAALRRRNVAVR